MYQVKTPVLLDTIGYLRNASKGLASGTMEAAEAKAVAIVEGKVIDTVGMDIKARMAGAKIAALEAKQINGLVAKTTVVEITDANAA